MRRLRLAVSVLALLLLVSGGLVGQEKKDDKKADDTKSEKAAPKLKGVLPAGFKSLGLSDEQKQKIYRIQHDYKEKIDALESQIAALKKQQRQEYDKVLTPAQKARLKELRD